MKLSVSFFLWKHRINARGTAPLYCRIILGDEIKQFSTALFLNPEDWSGTKQRVLSSHELAPLYNQTLSKLALTIEAKFLELKLMGKELSVGSLHPGSRKKLKTLTLLKAYDEYISRMQRLKGKKYALSTIQKFQQSQQHAQRAIANMKRKDLPLTFLKANFIDLFIETGLSHNYSLSTINKAIKNLKQIISYSIKNEYLDKDPFLGIRLTHDKKQIKFLTLDELQKMESVSLPNNKLEHARDCFIFSCYTGLAYTEAKALKFSDIYTDKEGRRWLKVSRQKTSKDYEIPLFPKALEIIEKYKPLGKLPLVSNQKFNEYIKEVALLAKVNKRITHHIARKTFATTICLGNDIPMEITSKLLGHSSISITESSYGSITKSLITRHTRNIR